MGSLFNDALLRALQSQATRHKVFISYHHHNDQSYKSDLLIMNEQNKIFIDCSVDTGDISDDLDDRAIREKIRDEYLQDSSVTIVLVGTQTKERKHVDWEIYSSIHDGTVNKKSGILVINLPTIQCPFFNVSHAGEKERIYPEINSWTYINNRAEYERRYPYMPARIIDNLLVNDVRISVVNWNKIQNQPENLRFLIKATYDDRAGCNYDLSRAMRRRDG
jgi:hypothetical protein